MFVIAILLRATRCRFYIFPNIKIACIQGTALALTMLYHTDTDMLPRKRQPTVAVGHRRVFCKGMCICFNVLNQSADSITDYSQSAKNVCLHLKSHPDVKDRTQPRNNL